MDGSFPLLNIIDKACGATFTRFYFRGIFDCFLDNTLEHGLVPHVVPEFPTITGGEVIQGGAGESSCFKYGLFGDHCTKFDIVTGEGEKIEATLNKNEDLFYETLSSYGSFGILTEVKMNLLPAKENAELAPSYLNTDLAINIGRVGCNAFNSDSGKHGSHNKFLCLLNSKPETWTTTN